MNTIAKNEDLFSDFFQVGGYKNIVGGTANLSAGMVKGGSGNINRYLVVAYKRWSTAEVDALYKDYRIEGNKDIKKFPDWAVERAGTGNVYKEQIVADIQDMAVQPEPIVTTPTKKPMSTTNMLYIGLGVLAIVGVTVLVVRRK